MNVKETAEKDIREDLSKNGKCFLAFRKELDPVMQKLVRQHINKQRNLSFTRFYKANAQIIAHCFFTEGTVKYENYEKYYKDTTIKS